MDVALKIAVKETGSLLLDPNMIHPFVRVHIIDMKTSKYLAKKQSNMPGIYNKESVQVIDGSQKLSEKPTDFLMPMSTKFFDMRINGECRCAWNEEFIVNEFAHYIL